MLGSIWGSRYLGKTTTYCSKLRLQGSGFRAGHGTPYQQAVEFSDSVASENPPQLRLVLISSSTTHHTLYQGRNIYIYVYIYTHRHTHIYIYIRSQNRPPFEESHLGPSRMQMPNAEAASGTREC